MSEDVGPELTDGDELMLRNVRSRFWFTDGKVTSQVFEPTDEDAQLLSVDRASLSSPKKCFELFLTRPAATSAGVLGVSAAECSANEVPAMENPLVDNDAHAVLDFRAHNTSQTKKRAKKLRDFAVARGWLFGPKT